jgi:LuxR family maltose regulon positive regulatory protein
MKSGKTMKNDPAERLPQYENLLSTKFEIPVLHSRIVRRDRLTSLFQAGRPDTLVVAPTGYGKTTLLVEWLYTMLSPDWRTTWITLDTENNSPATFWTYIAAGLQKSFPGSDFSFNRIAQYIENPETVSALNPLFNEIARIPQLIYLILDDYQVITDDHIHQSVSYLFEHQPDNLHVILSSRSIPPIPLSRLRAQRKLLEITARDLAFTSQESRMYLSEVLPLELDSEQINSVIRLTEGWIAGLQLISSIIKNGSLPSIYIPADLAGEPEVIAYILEETINQQPAEIQEFLISVSILPELCAPLCDSLLNRTDSDQLIQQIIKSNLFLYPAEDNKDWYICHPLFSQALQSYLLTTQPDRWRELHQKAFVWLRDHGYLQKAVPHALALGDLDSTADVIESCAQQAFIDSNITEVVNWVNCFPENSIFNHPHLGIFYAMANCMLGHAHLIEPKLKMIEHSLENPGANHLSPDEVKDLRWEIRMVRAMAECKYGDSERGIKGIDELINTAPEKDPYFSVLMASFLGESSLQANHLDLAISGFQRSFQIAAKHNYPLTMLYAHCGLARTYKHQGRLFEAELEYQRSLDMAIQANMDVDVLAFTQASLIDIALERNEQNESAAWVNSIVKNLNRLEDSLIQWEYRALTLVYLARYYLCHGDIQQAHYYFGIVNQFFTEHQQPEAYWPIEYINLQIRLWIVEGKLEEGINWIAERIRILKASNHAVPVELTAYGKILMTAGKMDQAAAILDEAEKMASTTGRGEVLLEVYVLQALIDHSNGDQQPAMQRIEKAMQIAAPQGYAWMFIAEGEPMKQLLSQYLEAITRQHAVNHSPREAFFLQRLISEFNHSTLLPCVHSSEPAIHTALISPMNEPLSNREVEVLELVAAGKSTKEIAADLKISINTAKTHIRNIHQKFGTNSKKALLDLAEEVLNQLKKA